MTTKRDEAERLIQRSIGAVFGPRAWRLVRHRPRLVWPAEDWLPDVDMFIEGDRVVVRADLTGLTREQITVEVAGGELLIRAPRQEGSEGRDYILQERFQGEYSRVLVLPEGASPSEIKATYRDGVLEIALPLAERARRSSRVTIT